jgi:hypothetical protein
LHLLLEVIVKKSTDQSDKPDAKQAREDSVLRLYELLLLAEKRPGVPSKALQAACQRQSTLAQYRNVAEHVIAMSLNTLKAIADEKIADGGWVKLDSARRRVKLIATNSNKPSKSPLAASRARSASLDRRNDEQFQTRAILYRAYTAAIAMLREFADDRPERIYKVDRLVAGYARSIDLRVLDETST